jgi:membrane fusion protein (multidrug efflux system)
MKKRMAIMLIICLIVFGGVIGFFFFKIAMMKKYMSKFAPPPAAVTTTTVESNVWHPYIEAVGSLKAEQSIEVTPDVGGKIVAIHFKSGQSVEQGAPLVDLDASTQQAQLKADQAQLALNKMDYQRTLTLSKRKAVSASEVDTARAKLEAQQAMVQGDEAALAKMHIVAPFAGRLGIREVSLGQYVAPPPASGGNIVQLSALDPMLVQFDLPQQDLPKLKMDQKIVVTVDAFPGKTFNGKITSTNADLTEDSRTLLVQAAVDNPARLLVPGMFVNVHVLLPAQKNIIMVPQTAIVYSLYGDSVYVVNKDKTVTQRFVTIGQAQGINVAITKGLQAGEEIVTSGQIKLHNGSAIKVNNSVLPN